MFEMIEEGEHTAVIKVIGVGGGGGNAVEHMINKGAKGVTEFIVANTDRQALAASSAPTKLQLGNSGLGAGSKPETGAAAANEAREDIRGALEGSNMVFITAGMGGGTGTGAAPIVAEVAREMGILTVGIVTKPFSFEGRHRMRQAESGINQLRDKVDSLIVVLNDKLEDVLGEDAELEDGFALADDVLYNACNGLSEVIQGHGRINADFADICTVMKEHGTAIMGAGRASGPDRGRLAAEQAIACPLLDGVNFSGAHGVLVYVSAAKPTMKEYRTAVETIGNFAAQDANIICAMSFDESLGEDLRVIVVATGIGRDDEKEKKPSPVVHLPDNRMPLQKQGTTDAPVIPAIVKAPVAAPAEPPVVSETVPAATIVAEPAPAVPETSGPSPTASDAELFGTSVPMPPPRQVGIKTERRIIGPGWDDNRWTGYKIPAFLRRQQD